MTHLDGSAIYIFQQRHHLLFWKNITFKQGQPYNMGRWKGVGIDDEMSTIVFKDEKLCMELLKWLNTDKKSRVILDKLNRPMFAYPLPKTWKKLVSPYIVTYSFEEMMDIYKGAEVKNVEYIS